MTRPAEALTIQVAGEQGIWTADNVPVSADERRAVTPPDFARWFERRWAATESSWLARKLCVSRFPVSISSAVALVIRLELRDQQLFRKWVAFSVVEREILEKWGMEGSRFQDRDDHVRFVFQPSEPPVSCEGPLVLIPCEELAPLHAYRRQFAAGPRSISLRR